MLHSKFQFRAVYNLVRTIENNWHIDEQSWFGGENLLKITSQILDFMVEISHQQNQCIHCTYIIVTKKYIRRRKLVFEASPSLAVEETLHN